MVPHCDTIARIRERAELARRKLAAIVRRVDTVVQFYRWSLRVRPEVTRAMLADDFFGAERCSCDGCRNFVAARELVYPAEFRERLALLGIDRRRETEVYGFPPVDGLAEYGGWFNFAGTIESGDDALRTGEGGSYTFELEAINDRFGIAVTTHTAIIRPEAWGHPVLQLEFRARVPWVIEPPAEDSFFKLPTT
jgi:hypothetical protein